MSDPTGQAAPTGPQEGRCGAIKGRDADGNPIRWCRKYPRKGQTRCEDDGGSSPQALAAAERRAAHETAERAVSTLGLRRDVSPEDALLEELQWTAGHVELLRQRVQELDPDALVWGVTEEKDVGSGEFGGLDVTSSAKPSVWWELYAAERKHLLAVAATALKAGVEQRRVELAEAQGRLVGEVIRAVLAKLGHDLADPQVLRVVSTELRALGGAA